DDLLKVAEAAILSSDEEDHMGGPLPNTAKDFLQQLRSSRVTTSIATTGGPNSSSMAGERKKMLLSSMKSPLAKRLFEAFKLSRSERINLRRFLQDMRRDDEYSLIAFYVTMERLRAAENFHMGNP